MTPAFVKFCATITGFKDIILVLLLIVLAFLALHGTATERSENATSQRRRKDFLIGGAQSETTHRVVSNLYNNL